MPWLIAAVVVVIGLAALVAVFSSGDDGDSAAAGTVQSAAVTVTGTPLADAGGSGMIDPCHRSGGGKDRSHPLRVDPHR